MRGSINETIWEVLQVLKTCGFTSVSSILVALCDSREHDTKYVTGIIVGIQGAFTEQVELLIVAGNAAVIFKSTYDSEMGIVASKVPFNKLWTDYDCIGKC
jgi:hypothetical protein